MMHLYRKYFPLIASAYSAAIFIYFTFMLDISKTKVDLFIYGNMVLMPFWAGYCWIVIYNQDNTIEKLTNAMESASASLAAVLAEMIEEEDEEETEKKV